MAKLKDVIGYLCQHYPYKDELSKARLTKLVYLADWKSCLDEGHQITPIKWRFNHYGPYVEDVIDTAREAREFRVIAETNMYGDPKERVVLARPREWSSLDEDDEQVLDHVIDETKSLIWSDFIKLVYSTYPILTSERHSVMDLESLARRYRRVSTAQ